MTCEPSEASYHKLLFLCCGVCLLSYIGSYMRVPVVPLYALSLGADTFQIGLINSSFLLTAALCSLPLGILSDRLGRKLLIIAGLFLTAITSFLLCLTSTPAQMIPVYLLFGIGMGALGPTLMSYVADFTPPTHLGRSYGLYTMGLYGGMSLGPAAGGFIAQRFDFISVFIISGIFLVCLALIVVFLFTPAPRQFRPKSLKRGNSAIAKAFFRNRPLMACWIVTLGACFGQGMFITFLPLHAKELGISVGMTGVIYAVQALFNAFSRLPFGYLGDTFMERPTLVIVGLVGFSLSLAGIGCSTGLYAVIAFSCTFGLSMGVAFSALGALISEVVDPESRGLAMGGYNTCIYLGLTLSAFVMGIIVKYTGFTAGFVVTAAATFTTVLIFYFLIKDLSAQKARLAVEPLTGNIE